MKRHPRILITALSAFSLGLIFCVSARTAVDEETEAVDALPDTREQGAGGAAAVKVTPQIDPIFFKTSPALREAIGSIGQAPQSQSIGMLREFRKNLFAPGHEKQIAAYALAGLLTQNPADAGDQEILNLYLEAAANDTLAVPARMHAADLAFVCGNEKAAQELLSPLLKKVEQTARAKVKGQEGGSAPAHLIKRDQILPEALYRLGESYYKSKDYPAAINVFERVKEVFPDTEFATGCSFYLGSISLETGNDWKSALKEFRHYLKVCPQGRNSIKIVEQMVAACQPQPSVEGAPESTTPPQIELTNNDRALIAMALYRHSRFPEALATWDSFGGKHVYRSVCLLRAGKRADGISALLKSIEEDPDNSLIPEVASAFCKPVSSKEALALWQEILKRNPGRLDAALWNVAKRMGAPAGAPYYARLVTERPTSEFAPESAWWLVWSEAKQAYGLAGSARKIHFARALGHCQKAVKVYGHTHIGPKFAFWQGKLHEALDQKPQALASYEHAENGFPGSYYGYRSKFRARHLRSELLESRSAEAAGKPKTVIPDRKWSMVVGRDNPDPDWSWPEPPALFHWQKLPHSIGETAATLLWLKQYNECFKHATGKVPNEVKAWTLLKQGQILKAGANASLKLDGYPAQTPRWRFAYPLAFGNIVAREAKKRSLDPLLIHGLIRQESRYDHNAVSRSNAMGLMQLLKGTAYGVAKHNSIPLNSPKEIFNPDTNIQLGSAYIAYVLKRADGNAMLAVASYNGGPNAAAKWLKQHQAAGIDDMDAYVEDIPYDETRDYVRKVFAHYWNYEHLYLSHKG
ncbi:MAG: transglycosylase SLT domain-containing protein [Candidatus Obscuribacterales bacterium]|nr:transglycosylase SLT domain-containing protein [Candidatus Obscuribacterales bacterium]